MLREVTREEAPHATERIACGTATWHAGENIIHIGGYARHAGVYPGATAMIAFAAHMPGHNLIHPEDISPASEGCKCIEQFTGGKLDRPDIKAGKVRGDG